MPLQLKRADVFFERTKRRRKELLSPEGVLLEIQIAGFMERCGAMLLDMIFMFAAIIAISITTIILIADKLSSLLVVTIVLFFGFVIRNCYFIHYELRWQGRTPGKKLCGLRVINRNGGELSPAAVIARNLTREVEVFVPLSLLFTIPADDGAWKHLCILGWVSVIALLPLWNKDRLRIGDLIAGTQVISMPKRRLQSDLTTEATGHEKVKYNFNHKQLAIYGRYELQVLEELLRKPARKNVQKILEEVCDKICEKINWKEKIPALEVRRFLADFYEAVRGELERGQLLGRVKRDKTDLGHNKGF